jgi:hypothetical protein
MLLAGVCDVIIFVAIDMVIKIKREKKERKLSKRDGDNP